MCQINKYIYFSLNKNSLIKKTIKKNRLFYQRQNNMTAWCGNSCNIKVVMKNVISQIDKTKIVHINNLILIFSATHVTLWYT